MTSKCLIDYAGNGIKHTYTSILGQVKSSDSYLARVAIQPLAERASLEVSLKSNFYQLITDCATQQSRKMLCLKDLGKMNINYDSLRLWFQREKMEYSKRSFWNVYKQEMVFGYINSSLPLVQVVLRGSLLHFCFDFGSASMAMLNVLPTRAWRNVARAFNSNIQRQPRKIAFTAQTWRNRFAKMPKWVLSFIFPWK